MTLINGNILSKIKKNQGDKNYHRKLLRELEIALDFQVAKLETRIFTDSGVVATLPGVNPETDIEPRQMAINSADSIMFINDGTKIVQWNVTSSATFIYESKSPSFVRVNDGAVTINIYGQNFTPSISVSQGTTTGGISISNLDVTYISKTQVNVTFTVGGSIESPGYTTIKLTQGDYTEQINQSVQPPA